MERSSNDLSSFPEELLMNIFYNLSCKNIIILGQTCTTLNRISKDNSIWKLCCSDTFGDESFFQSWLVEHKQNYFDLFKARSKTYFIVFYDTFKNPVLFFPESKEKDFTVEQSYRYSGTPEESSMWHPVFILYSQDDRNIRLKKTMKTCITDDEYQWIKENERSADGKVFLMTERKMF